MIPKLYLSSALPHVFSKIIKSVGLSKDKIQMITQDGAPQTLPRSFSYKLHNFDSYSFYKQQNKTNQPPTPEQLNSQTTSKTKETVVLVEGGIKNNFLTSNILKYCKDNDINFVYLNGTLPFAETLLLQGDKSLNANTKIGDALNEIQKDKGEENINVLTTNTGYLSLKNNLNFAPKNLIHLSPLFDDKSLQFLNHNCKKLLHANYKQTILDEIKQSEEITEEKLKILYTLYYSPLKEILSTFESLPIKKTRINSKQHFIFSREDLVQPYNPKSLDGVDINAEDVLFVMNDYKSIMALESSQDPIVYILDYVLKGSSVTK